MSAEVPRGGASIELRNIALKAGELPLFEDLSLRIDAGRVAMVMGSAGSGKSSLLKVAAGIVLPDGGEVLFDGRSLSGLSRQESANFRRRCGFVFQDAALWSNQSLYDNVAFPLRYHRPTASAAEVEAAVRKATELAGFSKSLSARPSDISGGERHLVGLARALVLDPDTLFLDEPMASLDETETAHIIELIAELKSRGRTILMASTNHNLAFRAADLIGVLRVGRIIAWGSYDEALRWTDPLLKSAVGRLKVRRDGDPMVGAWADAFAEGQHMGEGFGGTTED